MAKVPYGSMTVRESIIIFSLYISNQNLKRLRREYTGDWINDKKTGRGTMFYKNEDRYDGYLVYNIISLNSIFY